MFKGQGGLALTVVDLPDVTRALIRVSGIYGRATGVVMPAERLETSGYIGYRIQLDGRTVYLLTMRDRSGWASPFYDQEGLIYVELANAERYAEELYKKFVEQERAGTIQRLQRFDRAGAEARAVSSFKMQANQLLQYCKHAPEVRIEWQGVTDEALMDNPSPCDSAASVFSGLCYLSTVRSLLTGIQTIVCRPGEDGVLTLSGATLLWPRDSKRSRSAGDIMTLALPDGRSLGQHVIEAQTKICADAARQHFTLMHVWSESLLQGTERTLLAYGDGQRFARVFVGSGGGDPNRIWDVTFPDPRQATGHGKVILDIEQNRCSVLCGNRRVELSLLEGAEKLQLLQGATIVDPAANRRPHAIARDRKGRYYYVDQGGTPELERDFRVYRGPRGQMKKLTLIDVVDDATGEIFETPDGQLRVHRNPKEAQWVEGHSSVSLDVLDVAESSNLIYNELGVYMDLRLQVPCDDL